MLNGRDSNRKSKSARGRVSQRAFPSSNRKCEERLNKTFPPPAAQQHFSSLQQHGRKPPAPRKGKEKSLSSIFPYLHFPLASSLFPRAEKRGLRTEKTVFQGKTTETDEGATFAPVTIFTDVLLRNSGRGCTSFLPPSPGACCPLSVSGGAVLRWRKTRSSLFSNFLFCRRDDWKEEEENNPASSLPNNPFLT